MKLISFLVSWTLCCAACNNSREKQVEAFDRSKWLTQENGSYPYRESMLQSLISQHPIAGWKKDSVINFLGKPDRTQDGYLYYTISRNMIGNVFTLHTKTLVIKLGEDSTVEWRKIHQ